MMEMQRYIGVKEVNAKPMTRGEYNTLRGWKLPDNENGDDAGYLVEYIDGGSANTELYSGYVSWSPADVFKRAYKPLGSIPIHELTPEQVSAAFRKVTLEENYNFLEDDLVKLANTFVAAAAPAIIEAERQQCIEAARSVNHLVAERMAQIRNQ